eukprot:gnl/TRDRNA2_/TRDRNA2_128963_c0_seq1.p1 gnl/TRDRNA2_/TRDRNA2_128963_c0~~gnl/TRDRNA2_/TRDRNA2_128963_c0_seq1.p1  ORF type:complete len:336 (+),score=53.70 gnl/TRDRNA2_/TRDRNA2_128963_c0_seq1:46-1053(+)
MEDDERYESSEGLAASRLAATSAELREKLRQFGVDASENAAVADLRCQLRKKLKQREWPFEVQRLSDRTTVVVDIDRFGERPHMYIVRGRRKAVIVDTGCGTANLRDFLWTLPELDNCDLQVVNTHVHYDHIMGNHCFCKPGGASLCTQCIGICQGARDRQFSSNWQQTSLQTSVGASIQNFCVTDWLEEGDRIYLDDDRPTDEESLEVIYTPGHTPDSISLYLPCENRIFTGDLIYPGSIYLFLPGSNFDEFEQSLAKLRQFAGTKPPGVVLCCGHITPELPIACLEELHALLKSIRSNKARPQIAKVPHLSAKPVAVFQTQTFTLICRAEDVA